MDYKLVEKLFIDFESATDNFEGVECWSARDLQKLLCPYNMGRNKILPFLFTGKPLALAILLHSKLPPVTSKNFLQKNLTGYPGNCFFQLYLLYYPLK